MWGLRVTVAMSGELELKEEIDLDAHMSESKLPIGGGKGKCRGTRVSKRRRRQAPYL